MAQRLIHVMLSDRLADERIRDKDRFLFGSVIPDAYGAAGEVYDTRVASQRVTHFTTESADGCFRWFDYGKFYRSFTEEVLTDSLFLGYYIHLVQDACYRHFTHVEKAIVPQVMTGESVRAMHADYHLLNAYIVRSYPIPDGITKPADFEDGSLMRLFPFDADALLGEMKNDYTERPEGQTTILTERLLEEFAQGCLPFCREALDRALRGEAPPDPQRLGWKIN